MTECEHPAFFHSLCISCGKPQSLISTAGNTTALASKVTGSGAILQYNTKVLKGNDKLQELRKAKKLILVLDIDLTLLHSVQIDGATPSQTVQNNGEIHHLPIEEMVGDSIKHLVMKKRPFLDKFLEEASKLFRLHIYTAGTRRYAEAVVKVLDPKRTYIGNRIVSRTEGAALSRPDILTKSLNNIFFDEASMAVIMDDREDVWKGTQNEQLLLVRPYHYFYPGEISSTSVGAQGVVAEVNVLPTNNNGNGAGKVPETKPATGSKGPISPVISLHEKPGSIRGYASTTTPEFTEGDDQLLRCLDVLKQIHSDYFKELGNGNEHNTTGNNSPHVGKTVNSMKKKVLEGCTITFSGLIPITDPHPEHHFLWRLAISLGAQVSLHVTPRTTHLLSIQTDTKKVIDCTKTRSHDVWILHPDWLVYCRWSLSKVEEATFLLVPVVPGQALPQPKLDASPLPPEPAITNTNTGSNRASPALGNTLTTSTSGSTSSENSSSASVKPGDPRKRKHDQIFSTATTTDSISNSNRNVTSDEDRQESRRPKAVHLPSSSTTFVGIASKEEDSDDESAHHADYDEDYEQGEGDDDDEDDDCGGDCRVYYDKHMIAADGGDFVDEDASLEDIKYEQRYNLPLNDLGSDSDVAEANTPKKKSAYSDVDEEDEDDDYLKFEAMLEQRMMKNYASEEDEEDH